MAVVPFFVAQGTQFILTDKIEHFNRQTASTDLAGGEVRVWSHHVMSSCFQHTLQSWAWQGGRDPRSTGREVRACSRGASLRCAWAASLVAPSAALLCSDYSCWRSRILAFAWYFSWCLGLPQCLTLVSGDCSLCYDATLSKHSQYISNLP